MKEQVWESLLRQAESLIAHAELVTSAPIRWSFGGGTVLMLRLNHRHSKDVDIFLEDTQVLGFFNPRISEAATDVTASYEESAGHIKLYLPQGEIDFVVATPLIDNPFETAELLGHQVRLERSAEIIAKKMWHRGNLATARDLFDLSAVYMMDSSAIREAGPFLLRHATEFLAQIQGRQRVMRAEFDAIDRREFDMTFDECVDIALLLLRKDSASEIASDD